LFLRQRKPFDKTARGCDGQYFRINGYNLLMLVRKHFTEPSDATDESEGHAKNADGLARE
jgi:hypothetical protein